MNYFKLRGNFLKPSKSIKAKCLLLIDEKFKQEAEIDIGDEDEEWHYFKKDGEPAKFLEYDVEYDDDDGEIISKKLKA